MAEGRQTKHDDRPAAEGDGLLPEEVAAHVGSIPAPEIPPNPELIRQGWERRFTADRQRVQEALAMYAQMGFEVRAEPVRLEDLPEGCETCLLVGLLQFQTIYTRRPASE